jgi:sugar lactone lactonase YvrE/transposase-like protein
MSLYSDGLTFGEGPQWHDGALWVSDPQKGGIWTDSGGTWAFTPLAAQSNGLWFLPDGRLAGAVIGENRVGLWDGAGFGPYADLSSVAAGPLGDMVGDRRGGLYVDDVGYAIQLGEQPRPGRLIYVTPGGRARVAARDVDFPNGLAIIDDGRTLVVAETWAQRLTAFTIGPGGQLTDRRLFADLAAVVDPEARPDGMCAAAHGVWVCTLTAHAVALIDQSGQLVQTIGTGDGYPVACCLDPAGRLFVTVAETGGAPILEAVANKTVKTHVDIYEPAAMPEVPGRTRTGDLYDFPERERGLMPGKPPRYSPEFKENAIREVLDGEKSVAKVAHELGISSKTLGEWVTAYRRKLASQPIPAVMPDYERIKGLERRNGELEQENAFLKKAAAYFAKELL